MGNFRSGAAKMLLRLDVQFFRKRAPFALRLPDDSACAFGGARTLRCEPKREQALLDL